jgi:hypothetical protein
MQLRKVSWLRVVVGASLFFAIAGMVIGFAIPDWIVVSKYRPQVSFDSARWLEHQDGSDSPNRRKMVRDLVTNVLPGKSRAEIEALLGPSPSYDGMRRYTDADLQVRGRDEQGNWKPFPRSGVGHYFDEHEWDLIYDIGIEQILVYDHKGQELSPDPEYLIIRFDDHGKFQSWYIYGSTRWPKVVGSAAMVYFRETRNDKKS